MIALTFLAGLFLGSFVGAGIMAIVASGSDKRGQEEDEDFLSEPVEVPRRSMNRWTRLKVLP